MPGVHRLIRSGRARAAWLAVAALAAVAAWQGATAAASVAGPGQARGAAVTVTFSRHQATGGQLSNGFVGFSYSSSTLNDGLYAPAGNYPALLKNLGKSVLRFGGKQVDYSFNGITPAALSGLAGLTRATGWKVLYTVSLGRFNATKVTTDLKNVVKKLGASLFGVACGNEPELYAKRLRPASYTEQDYLTADLPACYSAVRAAAPKALFTGPDTFHTSWLPSYATAEKGKVQRIVEQYYGDPMCGFGTPATLLSQLTASKEEAVIAQTKAAALAAGVPFIIGETNSANCGGISGLSNTYVSALWAPSWVMIAADGGAQQIYFHGSLGRSCILYSPLCGLGADEFTARPVYYGLLFAHLMGTGATVPASVSGSTRVHAFALRYAPGKFRVMIENFGGTATSVSLNAAGMVGSAYTLTLTGPSLTATSGVRIQGAVVKAAGTFRPGKATRVVCKAGTCRLQLAAYSAVIVTLPRI